MGQPLDEESKETDELEKLVSRDNDPGTEDTADSKTPRKFSEKRKAPKTDKFSKKDGSKSDNGGGSDLDVTEITQQNKQI